jgi:hypothetical protein
MAGGQKKEKSHHVDDDRVAFTKKKKIPMRM